MALRERGASANEPEKHENTPGVHHANVPIGQPQEGSEDALTATFAQFGPGGRDTADKLNELITLYQAVADNPGDKAAEDAYMNALKGTITSIATGKITQVLTILSAGIAALAVLREDGDI